MIVITLALEKELPPTFKKKYPNSWVRFKELKSDGEQKYTGQPLLIVITGPGHLAKNATEWICTHFNPIEIINIGTCGSKKLPIHQWVQAIPDQHPFPPINQTYLPIHPSIPMNIQAATCDTVTNIPTPIQTDICDMELSHIASACQKTNVPYLSIKFITDQNNKNIESDFNSSLPIFHQILEPVLTTFFKSIPNTVSVIIPTLNRHNLINRAIKSVLTQTLLPNEIIVIDDGSSPSINYHHPLVSVLRNKQTLGVSAARNIGINAATSEWIATLDSDDEWHPDHLLSLIANCNTSPWLRWTQSDETWINNGKHINKKKHHQKPDGWGWKQSLERCLVSPSAVMIHKSMFIDFGTFDKSLPVCEDFDLWCRFFRHRPIGLISKKTVIKYAGHGDQLSFKYTAMDKYRVQSLIKQFNNETKPLYKKALHTVINKKLDILYQGAIKRMLTKDAKHYQQLKYELTYTK